MPLYEYECDACGQRFEVIQKFSDPTPEACEKCGKGPVRRLMSSPAIQFKGSGFYITDYAKKGASEGGSKGKSEGGKSESSGEAKTESKSATAGSSDGSGTKSDTSSTSTSTTSAPATTKKD
jgi:putative FmdB family regulatory protein